MSPAASKTAQAKAAKPSIVMVADSSGKAKAMTAAEEKPAKATKARASRAKSAALPKGTDLKAAADELLAAAEGKTKTAKTKDGRPILFEFNTAPDPRAKLMNLNTAPAPVVKISL